MSELIQSFDGYFTQIDYSQIVGNSLALKSFLEKMYPNDQVRVKRVYNEFLVFWDNFVLVNDPRSEKTCSDLFGFNLNQVDKYYFSNEEKALFRLTLYPEKFFNSSNNLIKQYHQILRALIPDLKIKRVDLFTSEMNGVRFNEKPFFDSFIWVITKVMPEKNDKKELLERFIISSFTNSKLLKYPSNQEGSFALAKTMVVKLAELKQQKLAA